MDPYASLLCYVCIEHCADRCTCWTHHLGNFFIRVHGFHLIKPPAHPLLKFSSPLLFFPSHIQIRLPYHIYCPTPSSIYLLQHLCLKYNNHTQTAESLISYPSASIVHRNGVLHIISYSRPRFLSANILSYTDTRHTPPSRVSHTHTAAPLRQDKVRSH